MPDAPEKAFSAAKGPGQADLWAGKTGETWAAFHPELDAMVGPLGRAAMDAADPQPGERVLDVGCGAGETALELARRVRPGGTVTGVDVSPPLLAVARARADAADLSGIRFLEADAGTLAATDAPVDLVYSRLGVMFFSDPAAGFANLRRLMRTGGRLVFACWGPRAENAWAALPVEILRRHVHDLEPPVPRAPGPFAFEERDHIASVLEEAGYADVEIARWASPVAIGGWDASVEEAVRFFLSVGPAAAALRDRGPGLRAALARDLDGLARAHAGPSGVRFPASAFIVTAKA
ncbi:MAG: class I SAM-dependent methyltransferase [Alphaproteobacteria bacterium]|nr:class I SAM-dependent methyltransferase [Alphaproteobacteria bacterium]MDX5369280.1 class I SAM-dependent methyltransferase [Alphaproteobacteria bacterium]MDX5463965.1 class I SAM-dependent methyltransferase [Alphaproteobacteria bacterium]